MKKFLVKILSFSLMGLLMVWGLDYWITKGMQNSAYEDVNTWAKVLDGGMSNDIIILGSSRAYRHFNPEYIEKELGLSALILGNSAAKVEFLSFALNLYLERNSKPKLIFWVLDYDTFEKSNEILDYQKFLPFVNTKPVKDFLAENGLISNLELMLPLARYAHWTRLKWEGLTSGMRKEESWSKGFYPSEASWDQEFDTNFRKNFKSSMFQTNDSLIKQFENQLLNLKAEGIESIFILPPYFLKEDFQYLNQSEIVQNYQRFAELSNGLFLDYGQNSCLNEERYFYDFYHLNKKGALEFNALLVKDLNSLLLLNSNFSSKNIFD